MVKYEQTEEPVVSPDGFGRPAFKIGQRVRVAFTTLAPSWLKKTEGKTGIVRCVVFCKSDGRTILYGVEFDQRSDGAVGGRYKSFELDEING